MADEEYEILPHKLLADLKYDVEALKDKLTRPDTKASELILEIESLKDSIHELNTIFEKALEQTKGEDVDKTILSISEKLKTVVAQNETIAKGMIAISDKLEDFIEKQTSKMQIASTAPQMRAPAQHSMGLPPSEMPRTAPRFELEVQPMPEGMPPPPPSKKPRNGFFR